MRRLPSFVLASAVALPVALAVPVATAPAPHVHPVAPRLHALTLRPVAVLRPHAAGHQVLLQTSPMSTPGYSTVGVTWAHGSTGTLDVTLRTRSHGHWSAWTDLGGRDDASPDAQSPDVHSAGLRDGTSPAWAGQSDGVQVRVTRLSGPTPRDLEVELVDPGTSSADGSLGQSAAPASTAAAVTGTPVVVRRAQWGADERLRTHNRGCSRHADYADTVVTGFVHHTVTTNSYSPSQSAAQIRGIYAYHVYGNGWCDIGYNFLVDHFGRVFEGRYGGIDKPVIGAHTGGFNYRGFAASLLGTFDAVRPSSAMRTALARLFAWKLGLTFRNPLGRSQQVAGYFNESRYKQGTLVTFNTISGHRDADVTGCPGNAAYATLPWLRRAVWTYMGAGFIAPSLTATSGGVQLKGGVLRTQWWQETVTNPLTGAVERTASGTTGSRVSTTWDLTDGTGTPVPLGDFAVTLTGAAGRMTARTWSGTISVLGTGADAPLWPLGTVLTAPGAGPSYWLVDEDANGTQVVRPLVGPDALASRQIPAAGVVQTTASQLAALPTGPVAGWREGQLVQAPGDATIWLMSGGQRRALSSDVVSALYAGLPVLPVSAAELNQVAQGAAVSDTLVHQPGTVVVANGTHYLVVATTAGVRELRPIVSQLALDSRVAADYQGLAASAGDLALPQDSSKAGLRDGFLLHSSDGAVYAISRGRARHVTRAGFDGLRLPWAGVLAGSLGDVGVPGDGSSALGPDVDQRQGTRTVTGFSALSPQWGTSTATVPGLVPGTPDPAPASLDPAYP